MVPTDTEVIQWKNIFSKNARIAITLKSKF